MAPEPTRMISVESMTAIDRRLARHLSTSASSWSSDLRVSVQSPTTMTTLQHATCSGKIHTIVGM